MTDKIPMTQKDLTKLIEDADMVVLCYGERRFALGPDIVAKLVAALREQEPVE